MRPCRFVSWAGGWALALLAMSLVPLTALADDLKPRVPQGKGEECVEPTEVMRRDHMNFLMHQRDDTMHLGIRTKQHSLNECLSCHVTPDENGKVARSDSPDHFCSSCHSFAAVRIDCFQCHADTPDTQSHLHSLTSEAASHHAQLVMSPAAQTGVQALTETDLQVISTVSEGTQ